MKLDADKFLQEIKTINPSLFISCASFEERCCAAASIVANATSSDALLFKTDRPSEKLSKSLEALLSMKWANPATLVDISITYPLLTFDSMFQALSKLSTIAMRSIVVDISTFTHEHIAILVKLLHTQDLLKYTYFAYVSVCNYGGETPTEHLWLSRGTADIRPVIGFPGMLRPSRPLHLVALVGFEFERIRVAIEEFEPNYVTLGIGERSESITTEHHGKNKDFYLRLMDFIDERLANVGLTKKFEFSCISPKSTKNHILRLMSDHPEHNYVLFPMNTKISTLGAIMAALENPSLQIAYVEPVEYNINKYSNGVDGFRIIYGGDIIDEANNLASLIDEDSPTSSPCNTR